MRVAVIGVGTIGHVHARILTMLGHDLVAVCDPDEKKTADFPNARRYADYRQMLCEERPEAVHICTPHYLHADMICEALKMNIHVLCEKPLCIRAEDIPRILKAERASQAQLGICLQNRYNPSSTFARAFLADKQNIRGGHATVVWHRDAAYYASGDWRGKWATEGGGVLINQALHTLDLLAWLLGDPQHVTACLSQTTLGDAIEVEDTAACFFSGTCDYSLFATNSGATDFPVQLSVCADGDMLTLTPKAVTVNGEPQPLPEDTLPALGKACYGASHTRLIADFYDCIGSGRRFAIGAAEGARSVKMVLACYQSKGEKTDI